MDFLTNIWNYIKTTFFGESKPEQATETAKKKNTIFPAHKKQVYKNEIGITGSKTDEQLQTEATRSRYITVTKNKDYKLKSGDTVSKIAKRFGVEERSVLDSNGLTKETAKRLRVGQTIKIPPSRKAKNVKNLNDVAKSLGVSTDFIKKLKRAEDSAKLADNRFHNTPYTDEAGVKTIGVGHVLKKGEPQKLTNAQVCELLSNDLLKAEENLYSVMGGKARYDKLPTPIKEALLDMVFNKGTDIITKTPGLLYALKTGKYEAAINKMTYNKSTKTGQEMSGLCKRRILDISLAAKIYNGKIPRSNINTAQELYNRGVELLKDECKAKGLNFANVLAGYNKDITGYMGNRLKLVKAK